MDWLRKLRGEKKPPEIPDYFLENEELSAEQIERKRRSEALLAKRSVAINPHLPCIESEEEAEFRSSKQIYQRLTAVTIVALRAAEFGNPEPDRAVDDLIHELISERGAADWFTPEESEFLRAANPSEHVCIQLSWRYEAAYALLWALDVSKPNLPFPDAVVDVGTAFEALRDRFETLAAAERKENRVILDEADIIYRCHWAVRQSSIDGIETGGNLEPGVVIERHRALNWLIGYENQDWDEITTDT